MGLRVEMKRQVITPLIEAVQAQNSEAVRRRIAAGDNIEATDSYGQTALHWAAKNESVEIVNLLLLAGANVNARDEDGETPLQAARLKGRSTIAEVLAQAETKRSSAPPHATTGSSSTKKRWCQFWKGAR
ncbi:MAG TPA: ankyrin repeat domain-containing protein [Anaerolineae bacterium]|nr:ankyrin repeat domain-containing protein [Anaerolineae bacterium]